MRIPPGKDRDNATLNLFRGPRHCTHCGRFGYCEAAHLKAKGMGGGGRMDIIPNLISLCRQCHDGNHLRNDPPYEVLCDHVAKREGVPLLLLMAFLDACRNAPKGSPVPELRVWKP